jgi:hypothetical protein
LALLWVALRRGSFERLRCDPQALCAMMLFAAALLGAMTSSDLPGNRLMFMMLGVLALFAMRPVGAAAPVAARPDTDDGSARSGRAAGRC